MCIHQLVFLHFTELTLVQTALEIQVVYCIQVWPTILLKGKMCLVYGPAAAR